MLEEAKTAIRHGELSKLATLLESDPNMLQKTNPSWTLSWTLLNLAVGTEPDAIPPNAVPIIKLLVEAGAQIDAEGRGPDGFTTLIQAVNNNNQEIIETLINLGANVNQPSACGTSPVMLALTNGFTDIARLLVDSGAHVDITVAAGIGDIDKLDSFFDDSQAILTGENERIEVGTFLMGKFLEPPLLAASKNGQLEAVFFLLKRGADINRFIKCDYPEEVCASVLHWAAHHGQYDLIKFLVNYGAALNARDDKWKSTAANWAQKAGHDQIANYLNFLNK
ncbi:MAG: ankyrin repeat domain-containing protein [Candidatus Obscuribacterales bacterium]|nr:ankyrin repeat domain-containing protein [Candidatus Obscuribacterales bacterium]